MCAAGECENRATELLKDWRASLLADFVDAVVGGGGLIFMPALFAVFPATRPATLFGVKTSALVDAFVEKPAYRSRRWPRQASVGIDVDGGQRWR